jgi:hypothetical protein
MNNLFEKNPETPIVPCISTSFVSDNIRILFNDKTSGFASRYFFIFSLYMEKVMNRKLQDFVMSIDFLKFRTMEKTINHT